MSQAVVINSSFKSEVEVDGSGRVIRSDGNGEDLRPEDDKDRQSRRAGIRRVQVAMEMTAQP